MGGGRIVVLADAGSVLAVMTLSNPAAFAADRGTLEFRIITQEDAALSGGNSIAAQIIAADGIEILSCDVGTRIPTP
jgi:hypothetical protein